MKASFFIIALLVSLVWADPCEDAFADCEWFFRPADPEEEPSIKVITLSGKKLDRPITPQVVSKNPNQTIGVLNMNRAIPEFILDDGEVVQITKVGEPTMVPTQIKPYAIRRIMGSAVGIQTPHGNQLEMMKGRCVRVRFTHFQRLLGKRSVRNVVVGRFSKKCVVFRTASD